MRGDEFFNLVSTKPPFTKLHPQLVDFFKEYFAREKVIEFDGRYVVNTNFPPFPGRAFDNLTEGFRLVGDASQRRLYSVTLAVTNRCPFRCWHCYNAGRSQQDLPLAKLTELAADLRELGAVMVTLTGGEPLLRADLEQIAGLFDERSCLVLGTTGAGLDAARARRLRQAGVFAVGISLDSADPAAHDRLRGRQGAYQIALDALQVAREAGLYPYVVSVATREFLAPDHFQRFLLLAKEAGALEVHLLEPSATGKLAGRDDVRLTDEERPQLFAYQEQVANDESLPILSSYAYLESESAFGCGAGLTHLYVDGSGEVCPCQLVPLSFGNILNEPLSAILERMGEHFRRPRTACLSALLCPAAGAACPTPPDETERICATRLPRRHALPKFFRLRAKAQSEVGLTELEAAYDQVHEDYDDSWLTAAAAPIEDLVAMLAWPDSVRAFEAGCGTGYATALLAPRAARVRAVDLSEGMLTRARQRVEAMGLTNISLAAGDALALLQCEGPFDLIFSSWVLGYIPLKPFVAAATAALTRNGQLAFVVHRENSPREALEIFAELIARDPSALQKRVAFDFPRDAAHIAAEMQQAGLTTERLWEGSAVFTYDTPQQVLDHLLKSGAGTAFYDALDPAKRPTLTREFLKMLETRHAQPGPYEVRHDYVACIAAKL